MSSGNEAKKQKTGDESGKWTVAIIGSGNWGSAIARIVGLNAAEHSDIFDKNVKIWTFEEEFEGASLTKQFNEKHENVKYLPGIKIPETVVANSDLVKVVEGANALIFVTPHQFIPRICEQLKGKLPKDCRAISLTKGVDVHKDKIHIFADVIEDHLGISCAALSGANIANEIAVDKFSETTIGCADAEDGEKWRRLFHRPSFRVQVTSDVRGVSLCGALKNVVAVAAGLVEGLGWGNNSKAAIMRIGLLEMKRFSEEFFEDVKPDTFLQESAGVADLITSCLGGRNARVAEAFVKQPGKSFDDLEQLMLNGQKLQGTCTAKELNEFLKARGKEDEYPLFTVVYRIAYEGVKPADLTAHI